jgi:hypothetical protein
MKRNRKRYALAALAAFVVATSSFAFAASNTFSGSSYAGDGSAVVSGYVVGSVDWDLNDTDPSTVDGVSFTTDNPAGEAHVRVDTTAGAGVSWTNWVACTGGATSWSCDLTGLSLTTLSVNGLEVAAAS